MRVEKKELCVYWMLYLGSDVVFFLSSFHTPELRTSGITLVLFIFTGPMSEWEINK